MSTMTESVFSICVVLVVIELLCKITSQNNTIKFLRGLITLVLFVSFAASFSSTFSQDINFSPESVQENENLTDYVDNAYKSSIQTQTDSYIRGLLNTIEINPLEIRVNTDNSGDGSISVDSIQVLLKDDIDKMRAKALLENMMGGNADVEVLSNEG